MPATMTPETAPQEPSDKPEESKVSDKKSEKPAEKAPEPKEQTKTPSAETAKDSGGQQAPQKPQESHDPNDNPESRMSRMRKWVRGKIGTVVLGGALVINPLVTGLAVAGRKTADKVLPNIPVVSKVYEGATKPIDKIASTALDATSAVLALPAAVPDALEDVKEVLTNTVRKESKGFIGRTREAITENGTKVIKKTFELGTTGVGKFFGALGWAKDTLTDPIKKMASGYGTAWKNHPVWTTLATGTVIGGVASMGVLPASKAVFDTSLAIFQGIANFLGVPVPTPAPL